MPNHEKLDYVEFPARDLSATKAFFSQVFKWDFQDYGEGYTAFTNQGLDGGFYRSELASVSAEGAALLVFYSATLEDTKKRIEQAGGSIVQDIFQFPGGRRFHFKEPSGNEFAVWSDQ